LAYTNKLNYGSSSPKLVGLIAFGLVVRQHIMTGVSGEKLGSKEIEEGAGVPRAYPPQGPNFLPLGPLLKDPTISQWN
jgi:hypothetical protein